MGQKLDLSRVNEDCCYECGRYTDRDPCEGCTMVVCGMCDNVHTCVDMPECPRCEGPLDLQNRCYDCEDYAAEMQDADADRVLEMMDEREEEYS